MRLMQASCSAEVKEEERHPAAAWGETFNAHCYYSSAAKTLAAALAALLLDRRAVQLPTHQSVPTIQLPTAIFPVQHEVQRSKFAYQLRKGSHGHLAVGAARWQTAFKTLRVRVCPPRRHRMKKHTATMDKASCMQLRACNKNTQSHKQARLQQQRGLTRAHCQTDGQRGGVKLLYAAGTVLGAVRESFQVSKEPFAATAPSTVQGAATAGACVVNYTPCRLLKCGRHSPSQPMHCRYADAVLMHTFYDFQAPSSDCAAVHLGGKDCRLITSKHRRGCLLQLQWSADAAAAAAEGGREELPALLRGWKARIRCGKDHVFLRTYRELKEGLWCSLCLASSFFTPGARLRALSRDRELEQAIREKQQQLLQEARQQMAKTAAAAAAAAAARATLPPSYKPHRVQQPRTPAAPQAAHAAAATEAYCKRLALQDVREFQQQQLKQQHSGNNSNSSTSGKKCLTEEQALAAGSLGGAEALRIVQRRYRVLALQVHPDKNPHPLAAEAMHLLTAALQEATILFRRASRGAAPPAGSVRDGSPEPKEGSTIKTAIDAQAGLIHTDKAALFRHPFHAPTYFTPSSPAHGHTQPSRSNTCETLANCMPAAGAGGSLKGSDAIKGKEQE
ncbi:uncharacterized protein LOC113146831 [Cyclospora cayetanensis]|uniref:Uncharacterized protein LOC113146831 n=1 Tax=Cyclospora cayetanensis TaxID=88456 RepID=A0A6P6RTI6_9EIME|nr:uncharacterized protein LOC113146831 [Cyclospora cayetanensis]